MSTLLAIAALLFLTSLLLFRVRRYHSRIFGCLVSFLLYNELVGFFVYGGNSLVTRKCFAIDASCSAKCLE